MTPVLATRRGGRAGLPALLAIVALLFAGLAAVAPAPARAADSTIDSVAAALKTNPVYVDPDAAAQLTSDQIAALDAQIGSMRSGVRTFVALLPNTAAFNRSSLLNDLYSRVGVQGVYAASVGRSFHALDFSKALRAGEADSLAVAAARSSGGDADTLLRNFVSSVDSAAVADASGKNSPVGRHPVTAPNNSPSALPAVIGFGALVVLGGGGFLVYRGRKRKREAAQRAADLARVRTAVDEDITAYGEVLDELDFDPADPAATDEMRHDYATALDQYERAKAASAEARQASDMSRVTEALEDGRFALATLAARRAGRPLPERRPPCFFDPRHGPSVGEVTWAPPNGAPRAVPACQADMFQVGQGVQPSVRTVQTQYGPQPYYNAGPAYGPWAGGYFGGGVLPALMVGTLMGSFLGDGRDTYIENNYYGDGGGGWGDGGTGGDSGSGGWGDFGGGSDWGGGGDSGGGDWGGGGDSGGGGDWGGGGGGDW